MFNSGTYTKIAIIVVAIVAVAIGPALSLAPFADAQSDYNKIRMLSGNT